MKCHVTPIANLLQEQPSNQPITINQTKNELLSSSQIVHSDMTAERKSILNMKFAKAVFVTRCPLSLHHYYLWQDFFEGLNPMYKIPTRKTLLTSLLDNFYTEMKQSITENVTLSKYLHLQCDGWSNIRHEGIINCMRNH